MRELHVQHDDLRHDDLLPELGQRQGCVVRGRCEGEDGREQGLFRPLPIANPMLHVLRRWPVRPSPAVQQGLRYGVRGHWREHAGRRSVHGVLPQQGRQDRDQRRRPRLDRRHQRRHVPAVHGRQGRRQDGSGPGRRAHRRRDGALKKKPRVIPMPSVARASPADLRIAGYRGMAYGYLGRNRSFLSSTD
eukprot:scaffold69255_cov66-Phaeocystis_antarctica.AAC.5